MFLGGGQQRFGSLGLGGMSMNNRNKPALPLGLVRGRNPSQASSLRFLSCFSSTDFLNVGHVEGLCNITDF